MKKNHNRLPTDKDSSKHLVETPEEINRELDVSLARIKEIQEKQKELEKENASLFFSPNREPVHRLLKESLELAHNSIKEITELNELKQRRPLCPS